METTLWAGGVLENPLCLPIHQEGFDSYTEWIDICVETRNQQTSVKGQIVNVLGFLSLMASVEIT